MPVPGDAVHDCREGREGVLQRVGLRVRTAEDAPDGQRPPADSETLLRDVPRPGGRNVFTSTYHPQTNGQTELLNRILESALSHYVAEDQEKLDDYLSALAFAYDRGVHKSTRTTPFDLVLSRPPAPLGAESVRDVPVIGDSWSKATFLRLLREAILSTGKQLERAQERYELDFDKRVASVNRNIKAGLLSSTSTGYPSVSTLTGYARRPLRQTACRRKANA